MEKGCHFSGFAKHMFKFSSDFAQQLNLSLRIKLFNVILLKLKSFFVESNVFISLVDKLRDTNILDFSSDNLCIFIVWLNIRVGPII